MGANPPVERSRENAADVVVLRCAVGGNQVAAKTGAVTFGLLEALGILFHQVAWTICFTGVVSEKRCRVFWINNIKRFLLPKTSKNWQN